MADARKIDPTLLDDIVGTVIKLQSAEGRSFENLIRTLWALLHAPGLDDISEDLAASFDLEGRSRMDGDPRYSLGLMIKSIDEFVDNPESDPNRLRLLRDLRTHFVPFARDYIKYVSTVTPQEDATLPEQSTFKRKIRWVASTVLSYMLGARRKLVHELT
jgi:hypothetical protein